MNEKFEFPFNELPKDLLEKELGNYLDPSHIVRIRQTSKANHTLFKPLGDEKKLTAFLEKAVRREDDAVQKMLKNDLSLLCKRGKVTDCSGRTFENISAFEYMLWALDKHGWMMLLDCIPKDKMNKELSKELLAQYNKVKNTGVTYTFNGKEITEHHFDFENTIIKALQDYEDMRNAPNPDFNSIDKQWKECVGGAQKLFPMHVVYEYCSDEFFVPVPTFNSKPRADSKSLIQETNILEDWFSVDSKLGSDFAIHRGNRWFSNGISVVSSQEMLSAEDDLAAMKKLCEIRTKDFTDLASAPESRLSISCSNPYGFIDHEFLEAINAGLLHLGGGTAGQFVVEQLLFGTKKSGGLMVNNPANMGFFQSFSKREDLLKIYSPLTAPVVFGILAAEMMYGFIVNTSLLHVSAATSNVDGFTQNASDLQKCLFNMIVLCIAALVSPIVNLIDIIGSGLNTISDGLEGCCTDRPSFF
ncbi:hypothetical protein [Legionella waltersii]|uniref:Uncharacterized protein n=1 Tax=Legionella waltersii TaxID=66969 RepID=A0A0W1AJK6_9GAMM|nr:hypothetical protein [Legionella waltersii]KTD81347.1 hypothetical protein Lwal_1056 [Legionella waltersii]SNV02745.1 SidC homolog [Legionella waltersii]